ncbi:MAG: hypothetical protein QXP04_00820, partial [Candidatus Nanoarchaeia archaeon]|nr:hypothetical protein [Candidatus Jingweiarchaeum tengchongense]
SIFKEKEVNINWENEINKIIISLNEEIESITQKKMSYLAKKNVQDMLLKKIEKLKKWAENKISKEKMMEIEELKKKVLLMILR